MNIHCHASKFGLIKIKLTRVGNIKPVNVSHRNTDFPPTPLEALQNKIETVKINT